MGIFNRLEYLIRSYLNDRDDESARIFGRDGSRSRDTGSRSGAAASGAFTDPDVRAAFEELDEFLNRSAPPGTGGNRESGAKNGGVNNGGASRPDRPVPGELRPDFAELGVPFGASAADCKAAYKDLLKKYHPDRHSGPENVRKATEKSARINAAWDRIERWGKT
ncbi:MAG: J domain-containing protein [Treponema sp.]|jgi:hypothetical protein|nr:J domain-containing protein [Treponema sp.]